MAFPSLLDRAPYITSYLALVLAARYCGRGPSIVTAVCAAVGASLLSHPFDITRLLLFIVSAGVLLWVVDAFRRARAESEKSAILAEQRLAEIERAAAHRAEEERVSSQLRAIVESSEDAIISKDLAGIIQTWNGGAEQIFGYTAAEAIGQPIRMLLTPDRLHEESDIMERIRRGGHLSHFETVRVRKDGKHDRRLDHGVADAQRGGGHHRGVAHRARHHGAQSVRGAVARNAEAGEPRRARGRAGARLQQPADRDHGQYQPRHG